MNILLFLSFFKIFVWKHWFLYTKIKNCERTIPTSHCLSLNDGFTNEKFKWIDDQLIILFSSGVTQKELRRIAEVVALHVPGLKKIGRAEQRDKCALKKWYYDNWDKIGDFLKNCVKAYDADNNVVDGNAEKLYYKSRKNKKSS